MAQVVEFENSEHLIRINPRDPASILDKVPPEVYRIKVHPKMGILLMKVTPRYTLPATVYGSKSKRAADIIWSAFERREGLLGALTTGLKGSGKSLLAEILGNRAIDNQMPVFIVDDKDLDKDVLEFVAKHTEPCMFLFDEFAKIFKDEKQGELLTFFSSTSFTKVLCLMAENESRNVSQYLLNRPGRMMFHLKYDAVTPEEAREVCQALNVSSEITVEIEQYVGVAEVSMDILKTLCMEAARCKSVEEFKELFSVLNIPKMEFHNFTLAIDGGRDESIEFQKQFNVTARLVSPGAIELTRTCIADGDTITEIWYPTRERRHTLQGWLCIEATATKSSAPPANVGQLLPVKYRWELPKEGEENPYSIKKPIDLDKPPF